MHFGTEELKTVLSSARNGKKKFDSKWLRDFLVSKAMRECPALHTACFANKFLFGTREGQFLVKQTKVSQTFSQWELLGNGKAVFKALFLNIVAFCMNQKCLLI